MHNNRTKKIFIMTILCLWLFPFISGAEMRSDSYIIRENVNYSPDGPAISGVVCDPGTTTATITWTTSAVADSFVIYSSSSDLSDSKEQGLTAKTSTSHSVTLVGLSDGTSYYYKVKSTGLDGGVTTSSEIKNFDTSVAPAAPAVSGGGVIYVGSSDNVAPAISLVEVPEVTYYTAKITWTTDELSNSFVEYGDSSQYGHTYGTWDSVTSHSVTLENLSPMANYYFRVLSADSAGNLSLSAGSNFMTMSKLLSELTDEEKSGLEEIGELKILLDQASAEPDDPDVAPVSESTLLEKFNIIKKLSDLLPSPVIIGQPRVEVNDNSAIISWSSDKRTNTVVAYARTGEYDPARPEPYRQVTGDFENYSLTHRLTINNLEPNTEYNYQVRMKPAIGREFLSDNFRFRTLDKGLAISNYYIDIDELERASFKWVTNKEADSAVKYTPYRGDTPSVEDTKMVKDNRMSVIHDINVEGFLSGTKYAIELLSMDSDGNLVIEEIREFTTGEDNAPPQITQVQTNSTIFVDRDDKVQTIISWKTDEPATGRVFYREGSGRVEDDWIKNTKLDTAFTKSHVAVVNEFKSGTIYSFRIEGTDPAGNSSLSKVYSFITPRQKQSVFNVIVGVFENMFGWMFG